MCVYTANATVQLCLIRIFRTEHSAVYSQRVIISGMVQCRRGVVTWCSASANHMQSARVFRIYFPHFTKPVTTNTSDVNKDSALKAKAINFALNAKDNVVIKKCKD